MHDMDILHDYDTEHIKEFIDKFITYKDFISELLDQRIRTIFQLFRETSTPSTTQFNS
jgi:hypothetical protein